MKKLNNKGYMLIEVILASVIAFVMAYFLIDVTIKLINKNNDYYVEGTLLADRNIITKEIMDDVNSRNLVMITQNSSKNYTFTFNDGESVVKKDLIFSDDNVITYGDFSKKISDKLVLGDIDLELDSNDKVINITISAHTNYSTLDYGINIIVPYNENIVIDLPKECQGINYLSEKPNAPLLIDSLIPVVYDESTSTWVKADTECLSSVYGWYNYEQKKWANAVLVTSTNRGSYQNASVGTTIEDEDILAFYVWIPRYKYKVWNKDKVIGTQSYNAQTEGIDIVFENGTASTGTISCTYSYAEPSNTAGSPNETCTGSNGNYYTHPAFTFGDQELTGFWMGKFELSSETPSVTNGGGTSVTLTPRILPNVTSWRYNLLSNFWKVIYDMQVSNNIYGLPTSRTNVDSHMVTNMEWGAVAYLTNSKYGRCANGSCTEVTINNCSNYITGFGGNTVSATQSSKCTYTTNKYNGERGTLASTTGNVYGVYDMSGGANEYVMGNIASASGTTYTYNARSAGTNFTYNASTSKYLTTYAYENGTFYGQRNANRGRLGDATGEIVLSKESNIGWYNDSSTFPDYYFAWFVRGSYYGLSTSSGMFSFYYDHSSDRKHYSTRALLATWN